MNKGNLNFKPNVFSSLFMVSHFGGGGAAAPTLAMNMDRNTVTVYKWPKVRAKKLDF
jgi:hypothetical protein